jgi:hypothetical protein
MGQGSVGAEDRMTQTYEEAGMEELLNKGRRSGHVSAAEVLAAIPEAEGSRERLSYMLWVV